MGHCGSLQKPRSDETWKEPGSIVLYDVRLGPRAIAGGQSSRRSSVTLVQTNVSEITAQRSECHRRGMLSRKIANQEKRKTWQMSSTQKPP